MVNALQLTLPVFLLIMPKWAIWGAGGKKATVGRGGGIHERNAYSLVLRTHPLPSFNINELGFSQSSCFLLVLKGLSSRTLSTGAEHMQTMLRLLKGLLDWSEERGWDFFFFFWSFRKLWYPECGTWAERRFAFFCNLETGQYKSHLFIIVKSLYFVQKIGGGTGFFFFSSIFGKILLVFF